MAAHYVEPGHTAIVVGAVYSRWLGPHGHAFAYRLKLVNETTGCCKLTGTGLGGNVLYVSVAELSHWHLLERPQG